MWTLVALLAASPPDMPWALAYSTYVARTCDGWEQRSGMIPLKDLPDPESFSIGRWSETGSSTRAYRRGLAAARKAHAGDAEFCQRPLRGAGREAANVERLLMRATPADPLITPTPRVGRAE